MSDVAATAPGQLKPGLVYFHSNTSGACRRVEGYIAQVLQRRRNHDTFTLVKVDADERPEIAQRVKIETLPIVVEGKRVVDRLATPRGCKELERFLAPWLN